MDYGESEYAAKTIATDREARPIDERVKYLRDQAERLSNTVGRLADRLTPILCENIEPTSDTNARRMSSSPLAGNLDTIGSLVELEVERLDSLLRRIEI